MACGKAKLSCGFETYSLSPKVITSPIPCGALEPVHWNPTGKKNTFKNLDFSSGAHEKHVHIGLFNCLSLLRVGVYNILFESHHFEIKSSESLFFAFDGLRPASPFINVDMRRCVSSGNALGSQASVQVSAPIAG